MIAQVRAVSPAEYKAWLARQRQAINTADDEAAAARKKLDADPQATP
jgi:heme/copper-type cytochrome/quinol oxidase subunit 2